MPPRFNGKTEFAPRFHKQSAGLVNAPEPVQEQAGGQGGEGDDEADAPEAVDPAPVVEAFGGREGGGAGVSDRLVLVGAGGVLLLLDGEDEPFECKRST
jgi:hypothetical protein